MAKLWKVLKKHFESHVELQEQHFQLAIAEQQDAEPSKRFNCGSATDRALNLAAVHNMLPDTTVPGQATPIVRQKDFVHLHYILTPEGAANLDRRLRTGQAGSSSNPARPVRASRGVP